jgi:hypothetical protein
VGKKTNACPLLASVTASWANYEHIGRQTGSTYHHHSDTYHNRFFQQTSWIAGSVDNFHLKQSIIDHQA